MRRLAQRAGAALAIGAVLATAVAEVQGCAEVIGADFDRPLAPAVCGDGVCSGAETSESCAGDCPARCGDGVCDTGENMCVCESDCGVSTCGDGCCGYGDFQNDISECPQDCQAPCGDGVCNPDAGESCASCYIDCYCSATEECRADAESSIREQCRKRDGQACASASDCGSSNCVYGLCCHVPCGLCSTCSPDGGSCVPAQTDSFCPGNPTCVDGVCQCANGLKDADEVGVDCGGSCAPC